jgi:PAS domain S-box-containing protein
MKIRGKIFISVMTTALLFFLSVFIYLGWNYRKNSINEAFRLADSFAQQSALKSKSILDNDISSVRTLANIFQEFIKTEKSTVTGKYPLMQKTVLQSNQRFLSVWASWEFSAIDKNYVKTFGRQRVIMLKERSGKIIETVDTLNMNGDDLKSLYYKIKINKGNEFALNPYYFKYKSTDLKDSILETSLVVKIFTENKLAALIAVDVALPELQNITNTELPFDSSSIFLVANNGTFISHQKQEFTGMYIDSFFNYNHSEIDIAENIKTGKNFSFKNLDEDGEIIGYTTFAPIIIGNSKEPWVLGITVPIESITKNAVKNFINTLLVGLLGFLLLTVVIFFISANIIRPLNHSINILHELETGNINIKHTLPEQRSDEMGMMAESLSKLIKSLNNTADFAVKIGTGNLNTEYQPSGDTDILGNALLEMRNNLLKAEYDRKDRIIENEKISWTQNGISMFGEILQQHVDNLDLLSDSITKNLVHYIKASQGGLFIYNSANKKLELRSAYAYDKKKKLQSSFEIGEGLVGRCAKEQKSIFMTDIPEGYTFISSGLGEENPKVLILIPLLHENTVAGVVELASFNPIEKYKIEFVETIGQRIATTFNNLRISDETNDLIKDFHEQSYELDKLKERADKLILANITAERTVSEVKNEYKNINEALGFIATIFYYDTDGNLLEMNRKAEYIFGKTDSLIGKSQSEIFPELKDNNKWYSLFWTDLKNGKHRKKEFHYVSKNQDIWLAETYYPILDSDGKIDKIICMGIDITKQKILEQKI